MEELEKARETIAKVQKKLQSRDRGLDKIELISETISGNLQPEEIWSANFTGSKAIRAIRLKLEADNLTQALRTTIIEAEFDGETTVWCPVGDFFGTGYQLRYLNTWYSLVEEDGTMQVFWVMPFEKNASLIIRNTGNEDVKINGEVLLSDWKWDTSSMHFGTSWHQYTGIFTRKGLTQQDTGSPFDINYVELTGQGTYVGDGLTLFNTSYVWWGEGDEKIYIDREALPSHFGTGTEDYYGYAWGGRSKRFSNHPFIAQPDKTGNAKPGYVVNIRQRCLDIIPFQEHLKLDMELWHWHATWVNYAPTCFYYLRPGGSTNILPDIAGAQAKVALKSTDIIPNVMKSGFMEAEHMAFSNSCGNKLGSMGINPFGDVPLSNNLHVIWRDGTPGDTIYFSFVADKEGIINMSAVFNAGPGFGVFKCLVNDRPILNRLSLHAINRSGKQVNLGRVPVRNGENIMSFIVLPGSTKAHLFAFDYLKLE